MSGAATAIGIGTAIGGVGSIASSAIGSSAAGKAADAQTQAANHAADLQYQASQEALDFQKQQYDTTQKQIAPWLQAGQGALQQLTSGTALGGSLTAPYGGTFTAPTGLTEQNDPGFQARLKLGTDAIQRSAAARGGVLTGGTAKALDTYAQDYASNEYNNVYNRALNDYTTKYNAYNTDQANQFNRLAALSGVGQTAANQLASSGQAASNNVTSNVLNTASSVGQQLNNAGAATASGYVGAGNAWGSGINGIGSNLSNLALLSALGKNPYQNLYNAQQLAASGGPMQYQGSNLDTLIGS
jgi:hypothetical protein